MAISFSFRQLTVVLLLVLFQCQAWAFDQHKPEDISDKSWASLKAAIEEAKLLPADGANSDYFGHSVSLSGNRALIGANYDFFGSALGSAYVFDLSGGSWIETAKLTASDGTAGDLFGWSVSLSGDRALVGAHGDGNNGSSSGSAYLFDFQGGSWTETVKLLPDDGNSYDFFGYSVSLSGGRALIGAYGDDGNGIESGSAYVFDYDGVSAWTESVKLAAGDGAGQEDFGYSVSLSDDRALIGALRDNDNGVYSGSAYVFELQGGSWAETAKLTASDGAARDYFGNSVSLSGDRALIGAFGNDDNGGDSGSAYVFELQGGSWSQAAKLLPADGALYDRFGVAVSLFGDRALIGADNDDDNGNYSGSAYVFGLHGGGWIETDKLIASDGEEGESFGFSVSLSDDRALIGAFLDNNNSGSAYVFELLDDLIFRNGFEFVDLIFRDGFEGP